MMNDYFGSKDKDEEVDDECLSVPKRNRGGRDRSDGESKKDELNNGIDEATKILSDSENPAPIPVDDSSYASKLNVNVNNDEKKLFFVPTCTNDKGDVVVRFEEELVMKGYEKWKFTKWDPETTNIKEAPCKIHVWIRLYNVLLEARSVKGISTISSRLGLHIKMDHMIAEMCKEGFDIDYVDSQMVKKTKLVKVEYSWKPERCNNCRVFGHSLYNCKAKPKANRNKIPTRKDHINANVKYAYKPKDPTPKHANNVTKEKSNNKDNISGSDKFHAETVWKISKKNARELKRNANKYTVLFDEENGSNGEDEFANKRLIYQWEAMVRNDRMGNNDSGKEDVFVNQNGAVHNITATETKSLKNPLNITLKKLDRIMCNDTFVSSFGKDHGIFLPFVVSDHNPSVLVTHDGMPRKKKSYYVADKKDFIAVVKHGWKLDIRGCHMFRVVKKMKSLKKALNDLNWNNANLFDKVMVLKHQLKDAQSNLEADPSNMDKRRNAKEGDKNSAFFHSVLKSRKHKNRVETICGEDGTRVVGNKVAEQFVNHFKNFLGNYVPFKPLSNLGDIAIKKLSMEDAAKMITEVTDVENKNALFDIDCNKATGPDGYTSCFFKNAWNLIGSDICLAVKDFFKKGNIFGELNATLIALVPKIDTPNKVSDFRLITCCNVLYKCISKILTNRIKDGLSKIVSLNQSAFIPGTHIQDNILITQEFLKGYNRKQGPKRCAMKIDIQKAYNTISWAFLKENLILVGLHETMVDWIMTYITSASFFIFVNGEVCGFFKGSRGLRQGDPVSPYLFTIVMDVLNMILVKEIREFGKFKYHYGCKELKLTHMCFAEDLLVLCNGDKEFIKVNSRDSTKGKSKVAWNLVCRPKNQGGLGKESLWVKWVNTVKLKGRSFGEVDPIDSDSWGWKSMLNLKDRIKPYVVYKVRDGKKISLWYDNWCSVGPLSDLITNRMIYDARFKDYVVWLDMDSKEVKYSTKIVWQCLKENWPKVDWRQFEACTSVVTLWIVAVCGGLRRFSGDVVGDFVLLLYYKMDLSGYEVPCILITCTSYTILEIIEDEVFDRLHNEDAVSLCCLGILQLVLLGVEANRRTPDWMLRLANDRVGWDNYPWGSYVWPTLYSQLKNANVKRWPKLYANQPATEIDKKTYSIFGYTWAFKRGPSSFQTHPNSSSFFNIGTPTNWQTSMSSQPGPSNWKIQMSAQSATPYWKPAFPSHRGDYNWQSLIPSHMGNPNLQPPIERHHDVVGLFNQNILNRGKREQRPSFYKRTPYTKQPPTTILPKQRGNKNKNNVMKANLSPLNLGNAFDDENEGGDDVIFLDCEFTGNYLVYGNVDPRKGYLVPVTFWQQLVPHLCMPEIDSCTLIGWLSGEHMNAWMELLIRYRSNNDPWTVAYTNEISVHLENQCFLIETDQHTIGTLDGSTRPYPACSAVNLGTYFVTYSY
nr:hypothetical protein [Tanacetum cinerariifolium]